MNFQRFVPAILYVVIAVAVGAGAWWLISNKPEVKKTEKPTPPATVMKPVKDDELNTVVLTEAAEGRLGVKVASAVKKDVRRVRLYGGDVTIPAGQTIIVSAPLGGLLKTVPGGMPRAGQAVKKGQAVCELLPLLTPEARTSIASSLVDADGLVATAKTQLDAAKIALDRAKVLLKQEAGSKRTVDEAQAVWDVASKSLEAAAARRTLLAKVVGEGDTGTTAPIRIDAPEDGILRTVSALPGQNVPSGAALFEVIDLSTVWVRVALPVGDREEIALTDAVQIGSLSAPANGKFEVAKPVAAPPSANPLAGTIDLFYELPNPYGSLIPGQRLGVTIPLNDAKQGVTVPRSAVVYDVHGGTWVYEVIGPRTYVRRRVVVRYIVKDDAVLEDGPSGKKFVQESTRVVVEGTQELFGAETGGGK